MCHWVSAIWALMYNGGVHATVAGVAMGLILRTTRDKGEDASPAERTEHLLRPGLGRCGGAAVRPLRGRSRASRARRWARYSPSRSRWGWCSAWSLGKTVGIFVGTYLAARFTRARLNPELAWADVFALAALAGIGFTVALLIGELAFPEPADAEHIKAAVLLGSLIAAALAALLLKRRNGIYRRLWEEENAGRGRRRHP